MFRVRPAGPASAVDSGGPPGSLSRGRSTRGAGGFAGGAGLLAHLVYLVVGVVVLVIVAGILLVVLKANATNTIVSDVHDAARWLAGGFDGMFSFHNARVAVALNWGIAAGLYLFVGGLIARLIGRTYR
jgi:hypothetical protein